MGPLSRPNHRQLSYHLARRVSGRRVEPVYKIIWRSPSPCPCRNARWPLFLAHSYLSLRSIEAEVGPEQPPALAVDQLGFPPSDIRSPSSGLQRNRFGSNLAGGRSAGRHRTPATRCLNTRSPALRAAAARAP